MTETVTIEKQVWASTLNRSMKLQAENEILKDKLEIAIKALKHYQDKHLCKEALKKITGD